MDKVEQISAAQRNGPGWARYVNAIIYVLQHVVETVRQTINSSSRLVSLKRASDIIETLR